MVDRFLRSIPNTFLQACAYARSAKRKWSAYRNTRVKKMWERVDPYEGKIAQGCLTCPPVQPLARFDMVIAFGFGYAAATKDGDLVFMERSIGHDVCSELSELWDAMGPNGYRDQGYPIVADIEELALRDPDHDWRITLDAPLRSRTYQRHAPGTWVLIESGRGFA